MSLAWDWYAEVDGVPIRLPYGELPPDHADRRVARDELGHVRVSTVFLGLDHRYGPDGPPLVYETMVFPSDSWTEQACERYSTREEALAGHARMVERWRLAPRPAGAPAVDWRLELRALRWDA